MIPLHCLWAKSNNRPRGQFDCDMTLFLLFLFDVVHSHAPCGCCSIDCSDVSRVFLGMPNSVGVFGAAVAPQEAPRI